MIPEVPPDRWRRISQLYHAALAREGDREAFLAHACGGDEVLRRAVESLLAEPPDSTFLDQAALNAAAPLMGHSDPSSLIGRSVGVYRVQSLIGAGGMGEVYRAHDTRLNRAVAIKFLSDELADASACRRFQREAQTASSLNHPHILTVHDVGELNGRAYLVTEFVDGGTLREWATGDTRPWPIAVDLLAGVADGLAAAHDAGIVHRDIKPENILVAKNGYAKLADFGLAKLFDAQAGEAATRAPSASHTRPGVILGTIAYMSPEQASGRPVDARSDIFSFGVVLYEVLARRHPFTGATGLEVLQQIQHQKPDRLGSEIPSTLREVVDKALEKDPADRYQSMREMVVDLRRAARQQAAPSAGLPHPRRILYAAVGTVVGGVALAFLLVHERPAPAIGQLVTRPITAFSDFATQPSLSSDGRMLAFIRGPSSFAGTGQIYVKLLPNGEPVQLTHDATQKMMPVFSLDGSRVVYTVRTPDNSWDTWEVPVLGGEARLWLPNASGLRWTTPQHLLFSEIKNGIHMALVAATESRTESRDVYVPESIRGMAHRSYLSPDGAWVIVTEMDSGGELPCRVVPFDGTTRGRIVGPTTGRCTHAAWAPDGRSLYVTSDASGSFQIWRQRFPNGAPEELTFGPTQAEGLAISADGTSVVTSIGFEQGAVWVSNNGTEQQVSAEGNALLPAWGDGFPTSVFSPDGKKIYYLVRAGAKSGFGSGELWEGDLASGTRERLLPGLAITSYDISADGERVVFAAPDPGGRSRIWLARLDRRSAPTILPPAEALGPVFGSDGVVYYRGREGALWYLYEHTLASGQTRKFTSDQAVNSPTISPDGQWILSWLPTAGKNTSIILKAFPKNGGAPVTICASCYLKWTRDQKHVFLSFSANNASEEGTTFVITLPPGRALPDFPAAGLQSEADARALKGVRVINRTDLFPGPTSSLYAFQRNVVQRNLYRIALPQD